MLGIHFVVDIDEIMKDIIPLAIEVDKYKEILHFEIRLNKLK